MDAVIEKLRKRNSQVRVRHLSNALDSILFATEHLSIDSGDVNNTTDPDNERERVTIQSSSVLAQNVDLLLADASALTFFIQFLEYYDKLNLIKFWIHVEGFKASLGQERAGCSQSAENSLALLDARNIFSKYIDTDSVCSISLPKKISERVYARLSERPISSDLFDEAKGFVHSLLELRYFKDFENSVYYKKYQLQVFSRWCSIDDILYVPALLNRFLEFVEDRHDYDCLQFLIACAAFETNYDSLSDEESLEDAMSIYNKYFSMQALSPIEIGDTARRKMESEICSDDGRPLRSSFHIAKRNCSLRIHDRYLENFVKSPAYQEFLKELEAEIQYTVELPRSNRAVKCGSSSSDTQALLFNQHFDVPDFKSTPPSRSSQPSPLLVRRNRSLNLAEIDCMGQYRVLYDDSLAQDNTTPSKIRQKLRKYLDKSTVREEEIAVEVARTIIADVHSMVEAGKR
ncbi:hypothetical protein V3C99_002736 [Haemonchus contortus]